MAGLFGASPVTGLSAGPLPTLPPQPAQPSSNWATRLGLFGAALQDAGAGFSGRPTGQHLAQYQQLMQQQLAQQALRDAASQDPAVRQRAYATLSGLGVNTEGLRQNAAAAAVPELLKNVTGYDSNVGLPAVSAPLPGGGTINAPAIQSEGHVQGMPLGDAINATPSPELASQFAPQLITQAIAQNTPKIENVGGHLVKYAPSATGPQDVQTLYDAPVKSNPNAPFNADGTPNIAYQKYEHQKAVEQANLGAQNNPNALLVPILRKMQSGQTLTPGEQSVLQAQKPTMVQPDEQSVATVANAIANYQQPMLSGFVQKTPWGQAVMAKVYAQNPQYDATHYATKQKSRNDFATGKNGNTVRSLNVAISHLDTLGQLATALGNGNLPLVNTIGQHYAQQTGSPAPTNFDSAKQIVGDEIVKAIIGTGGSQSDRKEAAVNISRASSPQQLAGVIQTYQHLLSGQLGGLKRQYQQTTGLNDFENYLAPETRTKLEGNSPVNAPQQTKTIGGQTYVNVNGKWYHQ